jgi:hypothetical protein
MSSERSGESHLSADTNSQPSASTDAPSKTVEESISLSIVSVPSSLRPTRKTQALFPAAFHLTFFFVCGSSSGERKGTDFTSSRWI